MTMELRHLRYFVAVAETGNLSRAAEKLFIAQPPLSVQIRLLEEEMGTALFVRHPKGVRLTAAGESLLPEARYLLDRASRMKESVTGSASSGHLALGFVPSASSTVLPKLIRLLKKAHPALHIELREMISSEQAEAIAAGHLDAGIVRSKPHHLRLTVAARMADPFCLAMTTQEARRAGDLVELRSFADHDFVAFTRHKGPAYFDQSIFLCAKAGFSPRIRYEASTVHGVLDLVGAGLGVALVPSSCSLLGTSGTTFCRLSQSAVIEALMLLRRKTDANPMLPILADAVTANFSDLRLRMSKVLGR
ncbi:LysR family transcriptional regulator [Variovorax rhizosphaerae]|uniref:LysR substrate-binding domain-containing protein n=1 Tax=Variovorax rhizosphaerae TaxID=1836200 RepID=A0ABU8WRU8_9BURK